MHQCISNNHPHSALHTMSIHFVFLTQRTGEESAAPFFLLYSSVTETVRIFNTSSFRCHSLCDGHGSLHRYNAETHVDKKGQGLCYLQDHQIKIKGKARKKEMNEAATSKGW